MILLCTALVSAAENLESDYDRMTDVRLIPEYHDFPLDNIHILRLQDAAKALGGNVSLLKNDLAQYEEQRSAEYRELKDSVREFESRVLTQMQGMQAAIDEVDGRDPVPVPQVQVPAPAEDDQNTYMVILMGVNIFLLILVIILIFWLREQYHQKHKHMKEDEEHLKQDKEREEIDFSDHIHPAPPELIDFVADRLKAKTKLHDIRVELAREGWTPSIIEHAIHAAKERKK